MQKKILAASLASGAALFLSTSLALPAQADTAVADVPVCGADKYFTQLTVEHFDTRRENGLLKVYVQVTNSDPKVSCRLTGVPQIRVGEVDAHFDRRIRNTLLRPGQSRYIRLTSSDPRTTPPGKCASKVQGYDVTVNGVSHAQQYDYQVCIDLAAEAYLNTVA